MKKIEDMVAKMSKKSDKMSDEDIKAKHDVLKELLDMAHGALAGKVKDGMGAMKVGVMAKDPKGLEEGLDKAKEVVHEMHHDGEPDHYATPDDENMPHGMLGDHNSNSLDEEAEKDKELPEEKEAEKMDKMPQAPDVESDDDELDGGLFAKKHREMALKKAMMKK